MAETVLGHNSQDNLLDPAQDVPQQGMMSQNYPDTPASTPQSTVDRRGVVDHQEDTLSKPPYSSFGQPTVQHQTDKQFLSDQHHSSRQSIPSSTQNQPYDERYRGIRDPSMQPMYSQHLHPQQGVSGSQGMNRECAGRIQRGCTETPSAAGVFSNEPRQGYGPYPSSNQSCQGCPGNFDPYTDRSPRCANQEPYTHRYPHARSPSCCRSQRPGDQRPVELYQPQSYAGVHHLKTTEADYPAINKRAFLVLSIIQAVCSLLILISGIVVAASNAGRVSANGPAVGTISVFYSILCGVSVTFGMLNYRTTTECRVITGLVLSVLCAVGSLGPIVLGMSNAVECSHLYFYCPGYVTGFSSFLIFLSLVVSVVAIVHSSFSCRAMCCLPPQRIVTSMPTNNNLEEHSTKM